jgi:UDPglucose 6-dehydrogenase
MRIAVIGTGYVGLVAGTCFADTGNDVTCVDLDEQKIALLGEGHLPLYEPGLAEVVLHNLREKRLSFTTGLAEAVSDAEVVFIAVGTPQGENGEADLQHVLEAAAQVGRALRRPAVVVCKSTVPVGTTEKVRAVLAEVAEVPFEVVSNPEFLKEGAALEDFQRPDRVVVGTDSPHARAVMESLYAPFVRTGNPVLFMDPRSAELTKYAANAMLAARISFMNDVAALCERVGADVDQVRRGMGADRRIGHPFLFPGVGYGGSCFPKDVRALIRMGQAQGVPMDLLQAAERTNERHKRLMVDKARTHFAAQGGLAGRTFAVWGLSFKPRTDDLREAPALTLIEALLEEGAKLRCHDPAAMDAARRLLGDRVLFCATPYEALEGADALFLVTEWNEFRHPDLDRVKALLRSPVVFDGRNVFAPGAMRERGFTWYGVGRP